VVGHKRRPPLPTDLVREAVEGLGYEFVGMERVVEGDQSVVRLYIDSLGGINVKDCETVSRKVNPLFDGPEDLFEGRYFLEVSSPGVERPLFSQKDFERFLGQRAQLSHRDGAGKIVKCTGTLSHVTEDAVSLRRDDGVEVVISLADMGRAHLVYEPEKPSKPGKGGTARAARS